MELSQIELDLKHADFQYRLKAINALSNYPSSTTVTLLLGQMNDEEFLVRTFVARKLGKHQTPESFAALLQLLKFDNTPNVRAEAANSLSLFGKICASHLLLAIHTDHHWLLTTSILAALIELECWDELLEVCNLALKRDDQTVRETSVNCLAALGNTANSEMALNLLFSLKDDESDRIRGCVQSALAYYSQPRAAELKLSMTTDK